MIPLVVVLGYMLIGVGTLRLGLRWLRNDMRRPFQCPISDDTASFLGGYAFFCCFLIWPIGIIVAWIVGGPKPRGIFRKLGRWGE